MEKRLLLSENASEEAANLELLRSSVYDVDVSVAPSLLAYLFLRKYSVNEGTNGSIDIPSCSDYVIHCLTTIAPLLPSVSRSVLEEVISSYSALLTSRYLDHVPDILLQCFVYLQSRAVHMGSPRMHFCTHCVKIAEVHHWDSTCLLRLLTRGLADPWSAIRNSLSSSVSLLLDDPEVCMDVLSSLTELLVEEQPWFVHDGVVTFFSQMLKRVDCRLSGSLLDLGGLDATYDGTRAAAMNAAWLTVTDRIASLLWSETILSSEKLPIRTTGRKALASALRLNPSVDTNSVIEKIVSEMNGSNVFLLDTLLQLLVSVTRSIPAWTPSSPEVADRIITTIRYALSHSTSLLRQTASAVASTLCLSSPDLEFAGGILKASRYDSLGEGDENAFDGLFLFADMLFKRATPYFERRPFSFSRRDREFVINKYADGAIRRLSSGFSPGSLVALQVNQRSPVNKSPNNDSSFFLKKNEFVAAFLISTEFDVFRERVFRLTLSYADCANFEVARAAQMALRSVLDILPNAQIMSYLQNTPWHPFLMVLLLKKSSVDEQIVAHLAECLASATNAVRASSYLGFEASLLYMTRIAAPIAGLDELFLEQRQFMFQGHSYHAGSKLFAILKGRGLAFPDVLSKESKVAKLKEELERLFAISVVFPHFVSGVVRNCCDSNARATADGLAELCGVIASMSRVHAREVPSDRMLGLLEGILRSTLAIFRLNLDQQLPFEMDDFDGLDSFMVNAVLQHNLRRGDWVFSDFAKDLLLFVADQIERLLNSLPHVEFALRFASLRILHLIFYALRDEVVLNRLVRLLVSASNDICMCASGSHLHCSNSSSLEPTTPSTKALVVGTDTEGDQPEGNGSSESSDNDDDDDNWDSDDSDADEEEDVSPDTDLSSTVIEFMGEQTRERARCIGLIWSLLMSTEGAEWLRTAVKGQMHVTHGLLLKLIEICKEDFSYLHFPLSA